MSEQIKVDNVFEVKVELGEEQEITKELLEKKLGVYDTSDGEDLGEPDSINEIKVTFGR